MANPLWSSELSQFAIPLSTALDKNPHLQTISVSACICQKFDLPKSVFGDLAAKMPFGKICGGADILLLRRSRSNPEHPHKWTLPTTTVQASDKTLLDAVVRAVSECAGMQVQKITKALGWCEDAKESRKTYYFLVETVETSGAYLNLRDWKMPDGYYYASFFDLVRTSDNYGNYPDNSIPEFVNVAMNVTGGLGRKYLCIEMVEREDEPTGFRRVSGGTGK